MWSSKQFVKEILVTVPRLLVPKATYLVTRRCAQRMFLLTPRPDVNRVFAYCLAKAAEMYRIEIHAFIVLSNHYHIVLSECAETVQLPQFMRFLNFSVARALNIHYRRKENFWSSRPYSAVRLIDQSAVLDKLVYTLLNAVKSGLVSKTCDWPGLHSSVKSIGAEEIVAKRPELFFSKLLDEPQAVRIRTTIPPQFRELSLRRFRALVLSCVRRRLVKHTEQRQASGKSVVGSVAVLNQDPFSVPKERELGTLLNPKVACKNKDLRELVLAQLKKFYEGYREAWKLWKRGFRDTIFPFGTYLMPRLHKVRCAEADINSCLLPTHS